MSYILGQGFCYDVYLAISSFVASFLAVSKSRVNTNSSVSIRLSGKSFDINLMSKFVGQLAPFFQDTDIEIIETHHNRKKDAPSGTALILANSINKSLNNRMEYTFNRHSLHEKREKNERRLKK